MKENLYEILEIARDASPEEVRIAYLQMAKKWHPDSNHSVNSASQFLKISGAYETLSNLSLREQYDASLLKYSLKEKMADFHDFFVQPDRNEGFRRKRNSNPVIRENELKEVLRNNFFFCNMRNYRNL